MHSPETTTDPYERDDWAAEPVDRERLARIAAFGIGAAVGIALALIWVPEPRRRRGPQTLARGYDRARDAGGSAIREVRRVARESAAELKEDLAATLEAAREELTEMTGEQLEKAREYLEREYRNLGR
jgi:signal transduction histidine kinase